MFTMSAYKNIYSLCLNSTLNSSPLAIFVSLCLCIGTKNTTLFPYFCNSEAFVIKDVSLPPFWFSCNLAAVLVIKNVLPPPPCVAVTNASVASITVC